MTTAMRIGYARTSTIEQIAGFDAQQRDLEAAGCKKVFKEQVSSVAHRGQLQAAIEYAREGDTLVVTKLDRLARSVAHLVEITKTLERKGVHLQILDMAIDTATVNGRLMLNILGAIGQFEREMMLERQREGIAKAKADGKYKGRKPMDTEKVDQIVGYRESGMAPAKIAREVGVARSTVYRILEQQCGRPN